MMKKYTNLAAPISDEIQKQQAIQALHFAQITNDYQQLVRNIACNLYENVTKIFPDHLQMIYLLTNDRRRQVWHAVIAADKTQDILKRGGKEIVKLRHALLNQKSTALLETAYIELPKSFEALLSRLGTEAQDHDVYLKLYEIALLGEPRLRKQMLEEEKLHPKTVRRLHALPVDLRNVRFVNSLQDDESVQSFVGLLEEMQSISFPEKTALEEKLLQAVKHSGNVSSVIKEIYIRLPFPPQLVPDSNLLRYLDCGLELEKAGKEFKNCLGVLVPQAIRGERQFYVWNNNAIVSLHKHRGCWVVDEIKLRDNQEPAAKFQKMIIAHFAERGVKKIQDFPSMLEPFLLKESFNFDAPRVNDEDGQFDFSYFMEAG